MQTMHKLVTLVIAACFFSTSLIRARPPRRGGTPATRSSRIGHSPRPRRMRSGRPRRHYRTARPWQSSSNIFFGLGASYWASSNYYRPWRCDYSPNYDLWYFRGAHAWYARPYGSWFYWQLGPQQHSQPTLVIEGDSSKRELWFAVYHNEDNTFIQKEAPRKLGGSGQKFLFKDRTARDIIVIARNKKALLSKLSRAQQTDKNIYIVQAGAVDKQKPINHEQFAVVRKQIKNKTLQKEELKKEMPLALEHASENLEIDKLID